MEPQVTSSLTVLSELVSCKHPFNLRNYTELADKVLLLFLPAQMSSRVWGAFDL